MADQPHTADPLHYGTETSGPGVAAGQGFPADQRLPTDQLVVEIDLRLEITARPGEFGNHTTPEFPVLHASADDDHGCVLRDVRIVKRGDARHGRPRPAL